ncbi:MAG: NADPH-dependent FMN reductase [Haloferacaceae archaeon]
MVKPRVVGVSGSRRDGSYTRAAVQYALGAADGSDVETDFVDLGDVDLPLYHPDEDDQGDAAELTRRVREADGVVLGSPVYHGSYASTLKNFLDYCGSDEFEDTVVGLLVVAGGDAYASALDHLRVTVRSLSGEAIPRQVGIPDASDQFVAGAPPVPGFDVRQTFTSAALRERTEALGREVAQRAARRAEPPLALADD